jgi:hypothetical protein
MRIKTSYSLVRGCQHSRKHTASIFKDAKFADCIVDSGENKSQMVGSGNQSQGWKIINRTSTVAFNTRVPRDVAS